MVRIAICDDEEKQLHQTETLLNAYFQSRPDLHGQVETFRSGGALLARAQNAGGFDLYVLDILMPHLDGFQVCAAVRRDSPVPILFLTAPGGCDDYVTKPFSLAVLLAKTQALIRRSRGGSGILTCGAISLDTGSRACTAAGRPVKLSPREYDLLLCLLRNRGQVLTRAQLLDKVWGIDFEGDDRAVDVRIRSLRAALGQAGGQIKTVFKAGYRLEEGAE